MTRDDSPALQALLDSGKPEVIIPAGDYTLHTPLRVTTPGQHVRGQGRTTHLLISGNPNAGAFVVEPIRGTTYDAWGPVLAGGHSVLTELDLLHWVLAEHRPLLTRNFLLRAGQDPSDKNEVYDRLRLCLEYAENNVAHFTSCFPEDVQGDTHQLIYLPAPADGITISDLQIGLADDVGHVMALLVTKWCRDVTFRNIHVASWKGAVLHAWECQGVTLENCTAEGGRPTTIWNAETPGSSACITSWGSRDTLVRDCRFQGPNLQLINCETGTRDLTIDRCTLDTYTDAALPDVGNLLGYHGNCKRGLLRDCRLQGDFLGNLPANPELLLRDCDFAGLREGNLDLKTWGGDYVHLFGRKWGPFNRSSVDVVLEAMDAGQDYLTAPLPWGIYRRAAYYLQSVDPFRSLLVHTGHPLPLEARKRTLITPYLTASSDPASPGYHGANKALTFYRNHGALPKAVLLRVEAEYWPG